MRVVLVILGTLCSALARPDVSHGYNYERGGGDNFIGAVPFQNNQLGVLTQSSSGSNTFTGADFTGGVGIGIGTGGIRGGGITGGLDFGRQQQNLRPVVTKNFYIHSAPEETDDQNAVRTVQLGRPQKSYRVVFIKAPGAGSRSASIQAIYPKNEEKTVIYVLSQKADDINIGDIATPAPSLPSKPEVFFIKYKTAEEAALAQQQIKAQYDKLGGTSQVSDEGVAPVQSVIGSISTSSSSSSSSSSISSSGFDTGYNTGSVSVTPGPTKGTYLPPSK